MKLRLLLYVTGIIIVAAACGGGDDGSGSNIASIGLSAKLHTDFQVNSSFENLKVVAVPITGYMPCLKYGDQEFLRTAEIAADGSFSIDLPKEMELEGGEFAGTYETDYVLLLVDYTDPDAPVVKQYISLKNGSGSKALSLQGQNSITKLPIQDSGSHIYAGTLIPGNTDEAMSESYSGGDFDLTSGQLEMIARSDDVVKSVKNDFLNMDIETKVCYHWNCFNHGEAAFSTVTGTYSTPGDFDFIGVTIQMWEQEWSTGILGTLESLTRETGRTTLALYPPDPVDGYSISNPITNDGTFELNGEGWDEINGDFSIETDDGRLGCSFANGSFLSSLPAGNWYLKKDGTTIATYDFAVGTPFYKDESGVETGDVKIYVPSIMIEVDGGGNVTAINIKYYQFNGTSYEEVTDSSMMVRDEIGIGISFVKPDGSCISLDDLSISSRYLLSDFSDQLPDPILLDGLNCITVNLNPGPFSYEFEWRLN